MNTRGDDRPAEAGSAAYVRDLKHSYDQLLKEGEEARIRLRQFQELGRDLEVWAAGIEKHTWNKSVMYTTYSNADDVKTMDFEVCVRPYYREIDNDE